LGDGRGFQEVFPEGRFDVGDKLSQNRGGFVGCDHGLGVGGWYCPARGGD
jgi:hypothetical protein